MFFYAIVAGNGTGLVNGILQLFAASLKCLKACVILNILPFYQLINPYCPFQLNAFPCSNSY